MASPTTQPAQRTDDPSRPAAPARDASTGTRRTPRKLDCSEAAAPRTGPAAEPAERSA